MRSGRAWDLACRRLAGFTATAPGGRRPERFRVRMSTRSRGLGVLLVPFMRTGTSPGPAARAVPTTSRYGEVPPRGYFKLAESDTAASYAEISDQLGLPVGSIGPTRGRCLERLRVPLQAT